MKKLRLLIIFCLMISCKENKSHNNTSIIIIQNKKIMTINLIEIKKHIELQKRIESDEVEYDNPYVLTPKDLELSFQIINEGLTKNGYKIPEINIFNSFVSLNNNEWGYAKYFDVNCLKWNNDNIFTHFQLVERQQFLFYSNKRFITDFFLLNEIIDIKADNSYSIKIPQNIINRNKYLFNDSKTSLAWLKLNDEYFLESLVKTFGYVEDKDLLKWVLDRNLSADKFDNVLFTKTCDNKYVFHKEIFEVMLKADAKNKEKYLLFLSKYRPQIDGAGFNDETKIKALFCYYSTKLSASLDSSFYYAFFPRLNDPKYEEEFKKNNYYNLSDFKELYYGAKDGGINLPE